MIKHDSNKDLIVRIGFVLGNITARHEDARIKFLTERYSVDILTNTLKLYCNNDIQVVYSFWFVHFLKSIISYFTYFKANTKRESKIEQQ